MPLEDIPAREFLKKLGSEFSGTRAVLCISAHWETEHPEVNAAARPETIHDFYGFPSELYRIKYPAKGSLNVAEEVVDLVEGAGMRCDLNRARGLDHGAWVPLMLMFPNADVPVVQLSIQHHLDPAKHLELGRAISALRREGLLILGSGGAVHPLGYADFWDGKPPDEWAIAFDDWLTDAVTHGDTDALARYRELAPYPERAHPRPDHYMPIMTTIGAAGIGAKGRVLHRSWYQGDLGMGAYSFKA
jgi:4,5-DOPA dioxygenase extradiol